VAKRQEEIKATAQKRAEMLKQREAAKKAGK
jgi:hypothetical protein